jgi:hypothetical protein
MECLFFTEIANRGWGMCGEILKMPIFEGVFDEGTPTFITIDGRVIRRLDFILNDIETHQLKEIKQREALRSRKKEKALVRDLIQLPDIKLNEDGNPHYPILLTSTAYIMPLGRIVTDESGSEEEAMQGQPDLPLKA